MPEVRKYFQMKIARFIYVVLIFVAKHTHCGFHREAVEKFFFTIIFCSSAACFIQLFILEKFRQKEKN